MYAILLLEMNADASHICIPHLIKYSLLTAVSKVVKDISILPGFTFPGILILILNRCEKRSCHTPLW